MRRAIWVLVVLVVLAGCAGSGRGSTRPTAWKLINLVKLARRHFPAYVGIRPLRLADDGTVYWTASEQGSDGRTLEVFRWRNANVSDIGSPGPQLSVWAVNDHEQFVVGTMPRPMPIGPAPTPPVPQPPFKAYLWQGGKLVPLGSLGGDNTDAIAINDRGQVVGGSDLSSGDRPPSHAFLWEKGKMTDLGTLGGRFSEATAINGPGQVIGTSQTAAGKLRAFIWQSGKMVDLGALGGGDTTPVAINERGQVIGQSSGSAFIWTKGTLTRPGKLDLTGYPLVCHGKLATSCEPRCPGPRCGLWGSVAQAINDGGGVVGMTQTGAGVGRAFLWRSGKLTDLQTLGGRSSQALAINDRGMIVGWSDTKLVPYTAESAPRPRPVLWQDGKTTELPVDYASPTRATAITPSGSEILGSADWPGHQLLLWTRR